MADVRLPSTVEKVLNELILKLIGTTFLPSTDICAIVDMLWWLNGYEWLIYFYYCPLYCCHCIAAYFGIGAA